MSDDFVHVVEVLLFLADASFIGLLSALFLWSDVTATIDLPSFGHCGKFNDQYSVPDTLLVKLGVLGSDADSPI